MNHDVLLIDPRDNVGVALVDITRGQRVRTSSGERMDAVDDIPYSHKMAIEDIRAGEPVRKYGEAIGCAQMDILRGSWVHAHNLETGEQ